jgi:hypothetical protein
MWGADAPNRGGRRGRDTYEPTPSDTFILVLQPPEPWLDIGAQEGRTKLRGELGDAS